MSFLNTSQVKHKKKYSPELTYDEKWYAFLFLDDILDSLATILPTNEKGVTRRVFIKVVPYCNSHERSLLFKFIRYINAHPYYLWDFVKVWSAGRTKYSRLLINDSDEIGYADIVLLYRT